MICGPVASHAPQCSQKREVGDAAGWSQSGQVSQYSCSSHSVQDSTSGAFAAPHFGHLTPCEPLIRLPL